MLKTTVAWPDNLALRAYKKNLILQDSEIVVDGPALTQSELDSVASTTHALFTLLWEICKRWCDGDLAKFGAMLGFSVAELEILLWGKARFTPDVFARTDLVKTIDGLKIVEFNVGSSVGGLIQTSLPYLLGLQQNHIPLTNWVKYLAAKVTSGSHGAIIEDAVALPLMQRTLRQMAQALNQGGHTHATVCSQKELEWNGQHLRCNGQPIDWVYPLFSAENVLADVTSYAALKAAVCANKVDMPVPQSGKIFGSKLALALLQQYAEDPQASIAQRELVRHWIPWTAHLQESQLTLAIAQQQELILKPALGYAGKGVVVGREVASEEWQRILKTILTDAVEPFVVQKFYPPLIEHFTTSHPQHGSCSYHGRSVYGVYVMDGKAGGAPLVRSAPADRSAAINFATGGAVGSLPVLYV
ncbi:MAG: hypothetical protein PUP92_32585 [Rhizonema sp. PD38]|nr:hypothetical protein [Rhizonema sp. PD38]